MKMEIQKLAQKLGKTVEQVTAEIGEDVFRLRRDPLGKVKSGFVTERIKSKSRKEKL